MAAAVLGLRAPAAAKIEPLNAAAEEPVGGAAARVRAQKRHSGAAVAAAAAEVPPSGGKAAKKQKLMHSVQLPAKVITPAEKVSAAAFVFYSMPGRQLQHYSLSCRLRLTHLPAVCAGIHCRLARPYDP